MEGERGGEVSGTEVWKHRDPSWLEHRGATLSVQSVFFDLLLLAASREHVCGVGLAPCPCIAGGAPCARRGATLHGAGRGAGAAVALVAGSGPGRVRTCARVVREAAGPGDAGRVGALPCWRSR